MAHSARSHPNRVVFIMFIPQPNQSELPSIIEVMVKPKYFKSRMALDKN
jgi:hypothetical protein